MTEVTEMVSKMWWLGGALVLGVAGCAANADTGFESSDADEMESAGEELAATTQPIGFGEVKVATIGCTPECAMVGSKSEGWRDGCSGKLLKWALCSDKAAYCGAIGTPNEGWYSTSGSLIANAHCSSQAKKNQLRAFTFQGKKGQHVDLYVDGLFERDGGAEPGLDTRARLYLGNKKLATSDDTTTPGWILRLNEAPNAHSSNLSMDLPSDGEYRLVVTSKGNRQGSAEVVVKTPDLDYCAIGEDFDEAIATTYFGAHNFDSEAEAKAWLAQTWPNADRAEVRPGPCNEPEMCNKIYAPVCAQTAQGVDIEFGNPCEFRNAVLADAGDETPQESKGKFVTGHCGDIDLCAVVLVNYPDNTDTYVYAMNFNDQATAEKYVADFPGVVSSSITEGACDEPRPCPMYYNPVCGQVANEEPKTYSNVCVFKGAVAQSAGSEWPSESKGFFHLGGCQ
ncbi:MAG TPA: hypothetical protein PLI95_14015 [Polyangiaceae bacterium]|nr:hypothetical protein [Polyangiaceae bacterium]